MGNNVKYMDDNSVQIEVKRKNGSLDYVLMDYEDWLRIKKEDKLIYISVNNDVLMTRQIYVARWILGIKDGTKINFLNKNKLDCRRINLSTSKNIFTQKDTYVEVETSNGKIFIVDEKDVDLIKMRTWRINATGHVCTIINSKYISLHRFLMNPPENMEVDHINRNTLDNRRSNLRICSHAENSRNRKKLTNNNKYKGVNYSKGRYIMSIGFNYKKKVIYFSNELAAANAYNYYAKELFGEFSNLNECPYMDKNEWEKHICKLGSTSLYRGVSLGYKNKWLAQIYDGKKNIRVGEFETELEAAKAYNKKLIDLGLDKERLNVIEE